MESFEGLVKRTVIEISQNEFGGVRRSCHSLAVKSSLLVSEENPQRAGAALLEREETCCSWEARLAAERRGLDKQQERDHRDRERLLKPAEEQELEQLSGEPSSVQKEDPLDSNPSMDSTPLPRSSEPVEVDREVPPCIPAAAARLQEVEVMGADRGLQAAEGQPEGHWITGGDERVGDQSEKDSNMEAEEMVRPLLSGRGHLRREKRRPVWTKDFELGLD
ncbi:uncharacterized protein [Paramormyrops kingsleyae]|uniref:uncharacterized protein n=1 Tax=Paramormyrops kingsleyae TaxID=1676925 RepID=UPI003B96D7E0